MIIKRLSGAGLVTHPHYKVNLPGDYSGINQYTSPDSLRPHVRWPVRFLVVDLRGVMNDAVC